MNRKTTIVLCTFLLAVGCAEDERAASLREPHADPTSAAQQVVAVDRDVLGPVRGTIDGVAFTGVVQVSRFVAKGGAVHAVGSLGELAGALSDEARAALGERGFEFPVVIGPTVRPTVIEGDAGAPDAGLGMVCDVLFVSLLPVRAEVLGRAVVLDEVMLDVTSEPSADSQIGSLLCAVSGLLDPAGQLGGPTPANLASAVALLNQLLWPSDAGAPTLPVVDGSVMTAPR